MKWVELGRFQYWAGKVRRRFGWRVEVLAFLPLGKNYCMALIRRTKAAEPAKKEGENNE